MNTILDEIMAEVEQELSRTIKHPQACRCTHCTTVQKNSEHKNWRTRKQQRLNSQNNNCK